MQGKIIPGAGKSFLTLFQHLECSSRRRKAISAWISSSRMQGKNIPGAGKRFLPGFQHLECSSRRRKAISAWISASRMQGKIFPDTNIGACRDGFR